MTHHIDLFLPSNGLGANYLVRMLDGRIDTQGTVQDLRARGLLDTIKHELPSETALAEDKIVTEAKPVSNKPVTKLVEAEEQAKGDVQVQIVSLIHPQLNSYRCSGAYTERIWRPLLTQFGFSSCGHAS